MLRVPALGRRLVFGLLRAARLLAQEALVVSFDGFALGLCDTQRRAGPFALERRPLRLGLGALDSASLPLFLTHLSEPMLEAQHELGGRESPAFAQGSCFELSALPPLGAQAFELLLLAGELEPAALELSPTFGELEVERFFARRAQGAKRFE